MLHYASTDLSPNGVPVDSVMPDIDLACWPSCSEASPTPSYKPSGNPISGCSYMEYRR